MTTDQRHGGGRLEEPRREQPSQVIAARIVEEAQVDLRRPVTCVRHQLARAWVEGHYACGCKFEAAGVSFGDVAVLIGVQPYWLRRQLLRGLAALSTDVCRRVA